MLKEAKLQRLAGCTSVRCFAEVASAAWGIPGDQITRDALLLTAGPIEAVSRTAAEMKDAKAAARRLWTLGDSMIRVPLLRG
ncbi:MAG: hypothetical protein COZ43_07620 [Sphingomonadales bacterium CG_4_10_14_3_um_filter_58_15]|nr:MAG: hypothetical protein COZ43_07620 [Sphingomonadales bacterium CG_4_10_14_3_um_filter_58_15]